MLLLQNIERLLLASKLLLIYSTRIGLCFKLSYKAGHVLNKTGKGPILRWRWSRGNIHWCKSLGGFDVSGSQIFIDASQRGSFSDQLIVRSCYGSCGNYDNGFHSFHFILQQFLPLWFKHRRKKNRLLLESVYSIVQGTELQTHWHQLLLQTEWKVTSVLSIVWQMQAQCTREDISWNANMYQGAGW